MKKFFIAISLLFFFATAAMAGPTLFEATPLMPLDEDPAPLKEPAISSITAHWTYARIRAAVESGILPPNKEAIMGLGFHNKEAKAVVNQLARDGVLVCKSKQWQLKTTQ